MGRRWVESGRCFFNNRQVAAVIAAPAVAVVVVADGGTRWLCHGFRDGWW